MCGAHNSLSEQRERERAIARNNSWHHSIRFRSFADRSTYVLYLWLNALLNSSWILQTHSKEELSVCSHRITYGINWREEIQPFIYTIRAMFAFMVILFFIENLGQSLYIGLRWWVWVAGEQAGDVSTIHVLINRFCSCKIICITSSYLKFTH